MAKKKVVYRAVWGKDCTCAELAPPDASVAVMAQIEQVLEEVRELCPNNSFIAILRGDDGWIFVPILGSDDDRSLCTVWPKESVVRFDVLANEGDKANSRKLDGENAATFFEGMRTRLERIKAEGAKRLGFTA